MSDTPNPPQSNSADSTPPSTPRPRPDGLRRANQQPPSQRPGYVPAPRKTPAEDPEKTIPIQAQPAQPAQPAQKPPAAPPPKAQPQVQPQKPAARPAAPAARPVQAPASRPPQQRPPQSPGNKRPSSSSRPRKPTFASKVGRIFFFTALAFVVFFFASILGGAALYLSIAAEVPDVNQLEARQSQFASSKIFDHSGNLLLELTDPTNPVAGRRNRVSLDQISDIARKATLATEDPNFCKYRVGFDPVAIARAVYYAYLERDFVSGGSTITQQVARNLLLSPKERTERSFSRKVREIILANAVLNKYGCNKILEIYLNEINYGNLAYGIEAASETYFDKPAKDLTLAEASMLAGIPQSPVLWDPVANKQNTLRRQAEVLRLMVQAGYAKQSEVAPALKVIEGRTFAAPPTNYSQVAPHYMQYLREQLNRDFTSDDLYGRGLRIFTTLDPKIQAIVETAVKEQVAKLADKHVTNGAAVALDPATGEILGMVGSADFNNDAIKGQVNVAVSLRQPGSSIKPFTYLAALEKGWTPATLYWDEKKTYTNQYGQAYTPRNYDGVFHGAMLMREALARSMNIPAVDTLNFVSVPDFLNYTHKFGINFPPNDAYGLAITLGGAEARLLDMAGAYGALANAGVCNANADLTGCGAPTAISRVEYADGTLARDYRTSPKVQVATPEHAYLITSILSDNDARKKSFGVNNVLRLSRPAAVKTGTTNDFRDNLTIGYTPDLVVGVWVGNTDNTEMQGTTGVTGAAPIWAQIVEQASADKPARDFPRPAGIIEQEICIDGGHSPSAACPPDRRRREVFKSDQPPLPADELVEAQARANNRSVSLTPTAAPVTASGDVLISDPANGTVIPRALLSIRGTVNMPGLSEYRVEYGDGDNPGQWKWISGPHLSPVTNDQLTQWSTEGLPAGRYTIRVTALVNGQVIQGYTRFDVGP